MIWLAASLALAAAVLAAGVLLLRAGLRSGDRPGDTAVSLVGIDRLSNIVTVQVHSPRGPAVLVGASVRRRSTRSIIAPHHRVAVPRSTTRESLGARRFDVLATVREGETTLIAVPIPDRVGRRGELVVAVGERDRLRIVRRALTLPGPSDRGTPPARGSQQREPVH